MLIMLNIFIPMENSPQNPSAANTQQQTQTLWIPTPHLPFCCLNMQLFLSSLHFFFSLWFLKCSLQNLREGKKQQWCYEWQVAINVYRRESVCVRAYEEVLGRRDWSSFSICLLPGVQHLSYHFSFKATRSALKGKEQEAEVMQNAFILQFKFSTFRIKHIGKYQNIAQGLTSYKIFAFF